MDKQGRGHCWMAALVPSPCTTRRSVVAGGAAGRTPDSLVLCNQCLANLARVQADCQEERRQEGQAGEGSAEPCARRAPS